MGAVLRPAGQRRAGQGHEVADGSGWRGGSSCTCTCGVRRRASAKMTQSLLPKPHISYTSGSPSRTQPHSQGRWPGPPGAHTLPYHHGRSLVAPTVCNLCALTAQTPNRTRQVVDQVHQRHRRHRGCAQEAVRQRVAQQRKREPRGGAWEQ